MFNLADLQGLAADESALNPTLSEMSVVLIHAVYGLLIDYSNWQGADEGLTLSEIDDIDAMVALLYFELTS